MTRRTRSKFRNVPTVVDNVRFDSKKEAARYQELKILQRHAQISDLQIHPAFHLEIRGEKVGKYEADFGYLDHRTGSRVIEDVKGVKTPVYRLKKKLMKAIYGIEIQEV